MLYFHNNHYPFFSLFVSSDAWQDHSAPLPGINPGPITIPSVSAIDGVLNHDNHNFIFMCAKSDFSGYHAFARTLKQHNRNAAEYQRALNQKGIYR